MIPFSVRVVDSLRVVPIDELKPGMIAARDIHSVANMYIPLVREHTALTDGMIEELRRRDIKSAFILDTEPVPDFNPPRKLYVPRAKPIIDIKLKKEALESLEKIFTVTSLGGENALASSSHVIEQMNTVVEELVASIEREPGALVNINDLKSYDEYTFHHSLSVTVLAMAVGQYLGFDSETLERIGMCGMMHDIGKTAVPVEIIRKPSKLSKSEFTIVREHPQEGYSYLLKTEMSKDEDILLGVLHHHEKFDGTGYPYGLSGYDIPLWSRIISVADVYDALTSNRPYRVPAQPGEAIEYIMGGVGSMFDFETVTSFVNKLELYPIGGRVELSDGRLAIVQNNENQLRPVVQEIASGMVLDLHRDRNCRSIVIKRLVPEDISGDEK